MLLNVIQVQQKTYQTVLNAIIGHISYTTKKKKWYNS